MNQDLKVATEVQTMSTVDISILTSIRHDNVMRTANKLSNKGLIQSPQIEEYGKINGLGL